MYDHNHGVIQKGLDRAIAGLADVLEFSRELVPHEKPAHAKYLLLCVNRDLDHVAACLQQVKANYEHAYQVGKLPEHVARYFNPQPFLKPEKGESNATEGKDMAR